MEKRIASLYRVHRPKNFNEVIGQDHVTHTLSNQIKSGRIGHAYLFCGTRGTGKTSTAKIFAHAVNCKTQNGDICGQCEYCSQAMSNGVDVFELDAASNNRVEDVRDLIEKVKYPPILSKYKVYIIDEVHMFSASAFNALLKTLEEPPSHVIFILATTEPQKLLETVQSRCLRFDFRTVADEEIARHITQIFKKEGIKADEDAIMQIARAGHGSVRDALSFADMITCFSGDKLITISAINAVLGTVEKDELDRLLRAIIQTDISAVREVCNKIFVVGRNLQNIILDFLVVIREYICANFSDPDIYKVASVYEKFSGIEKESKGARNPRNLFESTCLISCVQFKKKQN